MARPPRASARCSSSSFLIRWLRRFVVLYVLYVLVARCPNQLSPGPGPDTEFICRSAYRVQHEVLKPSLAYLQRTSYGQQGQTYYTNKVLPTYETYGEPAVKHTVKVYRTYVAPAVRYTWQRVGRPTVAFLQVQYETWVAPTLDRGLQETRIQYNTIAKPHVDQACTLARKWYDTVHGVLLHQVKPQVERTTAQVRTIYRNHVEPQAQHVFRTHLVPFYHQKFVPGIQQTTRRSVEFYHDTLVPHACYAFRKGVEHSRHGYHQYISPACAAGGHHAARFYQDTIRPVVHRLYRQHLGPHVDRYVDWHKVAAFNGEVVRYGQIGGRYLMLAVRKVYVYSVTTYTYLERTYRAYQYPNQATSPVIKDVVGGSQTTRSAVVSVQEQIAPAATTTMASAIHSAATEVTAAATTTPLPVYERIVEAAGQAKDDLQHAISGRMEQAKEAVASVVERVRPATVSDSSLETSAAATSPVINAGNIDDKVYRISSMTLIIGQAAHSADITAASEVASVASSLSIAPVASFSSTSDVSSKVNIQSSSTASGAVEVEPILSIQTAHPVDPALQETQTTEAYAEDYHTSVEDTTSPSLAHSGPTPSPDATASTPAHSRADPVTLSSDSAAQPHADAPRPVEPVNAAKEATFIPVDRQQAPAPAKVATQPSKKSAAPVAATPPAEPNPTPESIRRLVKSVAPAVIPPVLHDPELKEGVSRTLRRAAAAVTPTMNDEDVEDVKKAASEWVQHAKASIAAQFSSHNLSPEGEEASVDTAAAPLSTSVESSAPKAEITTPSKAVEEEITLVHASEAGPVKHDEL